MIHAQAQASLFKRNPLAAAIVLALSAPFISGVAHAGAGFGTGVYVANPAQSTPVKTYYANSPVGPVAALDPVTGLPSFDPVTQLVINTNSGTALRKFVDTLPGFPGLNASGFLNAANNLGQYVPLAVPEKWVDLNGVKTNDDYYEIAAVEYSEQMHSDLPKATHLRGYVQLSTVGNPGKHIPLTYPNGTPIVDAKGVQVYAFDTPHHLGPVINAASGTAVRVKFSNYLPSGGNLFLPVDKSLTGAGLSADGLTYYTENRAEIHLVGGQAPWISAGSPHQWVAPAAETAAYAAGVGKGPSSQNVPDMADPGAGATTLYFPNAHSARFMFYQDRTSGLTRLNSYAGLEAGYFVTDATEQALVSSGVIPADQIPLILEDKTFVPGNISQQDAKWDASHWGAPGDLWFPHVYETNQDPNSVNGTNPVGRWDFGPWFWPIFPATQNLPTGEYGNASVTPEAYQDTPLVNGTAYPTLTVDPKAYRFRILNASNDRYFNLGWYKADTTLRAPRLDANGNPVVDQNGVQQFLTNTEVKMVPALADVTGAPPTPVSGTPPANPTGYPYYEPNCLCQYPQLAQLMPAIQFSGPNRAWPIDNRIGGAPDPTSVGPDFISIGTDGGFLPSPVDVPSQPVTYESNRRSVTVGNVYGYGMLVGPAERADTIVDFSAYPGQTLILYNDAPTPFPFNDQRVDYFTGGPDQTGSGGNYSTKPGYGPNTRTVMQVKVRNTTVAATGKFSADALLSALPKAYAASQPNPIVPQAAYNAAFGTNDADVYAHVATGSVAQPNLDFSTTGTLTISGVNLISSGGQLVVGTTNIVGNAVPGSGTGYDPKNPPTVVFNNGACLASGQTSAQAFAAVDPVTHQVTSVTLGVPNQATVPTYSGYLCAPTITFSSPTGLGAQATVVTTTSQSVLVQTKAEQELFDASGRYNSTGGVELPWTSGTTQTTVPLSYIDSPTEILADGETQIWKIVDNGFWTNSLHFGFVDVQLINRVGWDGTLKPPASNEVGWKDTLRLNPLEDVVVAVRAKRAAVPFGLPVSQRAQDPSVALGAAGSNLGFLADPGVTSPTGTPLLTTTTNVSASYDNEFFWSTAVLGHAENDLTRPLVFHPTVLVPDAPTNVADVLGNGTLTWTDPTPAGLASTLANPKNELGFLILQAPVDSNGQVGQAFVQVDRVPANATHWTAPVAKGNVAYAVAAYNTAGASAPSSAVVEAAPVAPVQFSANPVNYNSVTLNFSGGTTNDVLQVLRNGAVLATLPGTATSFVDNAANATLYKYTPPVYPASNYTYQINAVNAFGNAATNTLAVSTPMVPVSAPTALTATANATGTSATLRWTDTANNETEYWVEISTDGGTTFGPVQKIARTAAQTTSTGTAVTGTLPTTPGLVYAFRVTAVNVTGTGTSLSTPISTVLDLSTGPALPAPTQLSATLASGTRATVTWTDNATTETSYLVTVTNVTTGVVSTVTVARNATQSAAVGTVSTSVTVAAGNVYTVSVVAQVTRFGLTAASPAAGPVKLDASVPASPTKVTATAGAVGSRSITVSWVDAPVNATSYTVQRATVTNGVVGAYTQIGTVLAGVQSFTDTGRTAGRSYVYEVRSTGLTGTSAYTVSNVAVAQ